jgi:integrase
VQRWLRRIQACRGIAARILGQTNITANDPDRYGRDQVGHSSIQVTVDVYGHLVPSANRAAVDRLDAVPIRIPDASEDEKSVGGDGGK